MVEHNSGRAAITHLKPYDGRVSSLLYYATDAGHLGVMQYLHEQGAGVDYGNALLCAIRRDRMDAVKWLLAHFPPMEKIPEYCVLVEAARYGRVEMLEYFQSSRKLKVPGFPGSVPSSIPQADTKFSFQVLASAANSYENPNHLRWLPTDAMDGAAANRQLEAVQWLHTHRSEGCTTLAMDEAAARGHLQVVKWLQANRSEGYTDHGMAIAAVRCQEEVVQFLVLQSLTKVTDIIVQKAVEKGQLALVKWLHAQSGARFTVKMLIKAVGGGHLEVLKYLYLHRSKGFSLKSCAAIIREALAYGHVRVAYWCVLRFPAHSPKPVMITTATVFESLLFQRFHSPESFIPAKLRERMGSFKVFGAVAKWLDAQIL